MIFCIQSFNWKGSKQSFGYVSQRLQYCDVICLTETWLRPYELHCIDDNIREADRIIYSKSAMTDIEPDYIGHPFGRVAIICRWNNSFPYKELPKDTGRMNVRCCWWTVQIVINVYMPCFNNTHNALKHWNYWHSTRFLSSIWRCCTY